jgi:hypothetical protein
MSVSPCIYTVTPASWLAVLAASGLALIMLLAALFHATRREYREVAITLVLGALPASSHSAGLSSSRRK